MHATGSVSSRSEYRSSSSLFRKDKRADTRCSNNLHDLGRYVHMGGLGLQLLCWKHGGSCTDQQKAGRHPMPMPQRRDTGLAARPPPESRTNAPNLRCRGLPVHRWTGQAASWTLGLSLLRKHPRFWLFSASGLSQPGTHRAAAYLATSATWAKLVTVSDVLARMQDLSICQQKRACPVAALRTTWRARAGRRGGDPHPARKSVRSCGTVDLGPVQFHWFFWHMHEVLNVDEKK